MSNAEQWREIAETMTVEATPQEERLETPEVAETVEAEIEAGEAIGMQQAEPRSARVLSISELRQKLGLETFEQPVARSAPPAQGRPRIVRRREADTDYEVMAAG